MPPLQAPELTDGVIRLRPLRASDGDAVIAAVQDPDIPRWTMIPSPYGPAEFDYWLARQANAREAGEGLHLLITDPEDDRVLGAVGVQALDTERPDIGYWVAREARGRGVATRAIRLLRDWLAASLAAEHVEILIDPANAPSRRTAEAAGFHATGEYRHDPRDLVGDYLVFAWPDAGGGAG